MEHCFRFALWMCLLIGYLQAKPVCTENNTKWEQIDIPNLGLGLLLEEVQCGTNVTFISPTNVLELCYTAAVELFIAELEEAKQNCNNTERIADTLEEIRVSYPDNTKCQLPSQCKWENAGSRTDFEAFLNNMKNFLSELNSK